MREKINFLLFTLIISGILGLANISPAFIIIGPTVSESTDEAGNLEYTINNPAGTGVTVLAFLVSNNTQPDPYRHVDSEINYDWIAEPSPVTNSSWDARLMGQPEIIWHGAESDEGETSDTTTWETFTNLPFIYTSFADTDNLMGYFLDYYVDDVTGDYVFTDISNGIAEGQTRGGFYADAAPMSDFLIVATDDDDDNTVDPNNITIYEGFVVPEPITMFLFLIAGALIRKK